MKKIVNGVYMTFTTVMIAYIAMEQMPLLIAILRLASNLLF